MNEIGVGFRLLLGPTLAAPTKVGNAVEQWRAANAPLQPGSIEYQYYVEYRSLLDKVW